MKSGCIVNRSQNVNAGQRSTQSGQQSIGQQSNCQTNCSVGCSVDQRSSQGPVHTA
ncbi:hypothetical protein A2U01_0056656 [Trifolium medium]|uniref:Uncharacterized protein n=1 Tax=Trifolium medium TaxID=97028 RepID=A0A392RIL0_9FABA|nr:hypothetical protein [Trifolium medium]